MANELAIWNAVRDTPKTAQKNFTRGGGFSGTDINPTYRMFRMTEQFGAFGMGWGWTIHSRWREQFPIALKSGDTLEEKDRDYVFVELSVWFVVDGKRYDTGPQIGGTEAGRTPDESYKMSVTDAFGKCTQGLGIGADIYEKTFDDSKYQRDKAAAESGGTAPGKTKRTPPPAAENTSAPNAQHGIHPVATYSALLWECRSQDDVINVLTKMDVDSGVTDEARNSLRYHTLLARLRTAPDGAELDVLKIEMSKSAWITPDNLAQLIAAGKQRREEVTKKGAA